MKSCYLCSSEVAEMDSWKFKFGCDEMHLCRSCHADFDSLDKFNNFIQNWTRQKMYSAAKQLTKLVAQGASNSDIAACASNLFNKIAQDEKIFSYLLSPRL